MKQGYVYWVHLPSQKIKTDGYVGVTTNYKRRWKEHKEKLHCKHFANAILYHKDNLVWDVIFHGPLEGCYQLEEYFRPNPDIGWNIAIGGTQSNNYKRVLSQDTKHKISVSKLGSIPWNKGKTGVYTQDTLKKIGDSTKSRTQGADNPMFGKTHSQEARLKISKAQEGKKVYSGKDNPSAKAIKCVETGEIFDTITAAAKQYNTSIQNISTALRKPGAKAKNLTWVYLKYPESLYKA